MIKNVVILGSTGSIGRNVLEVIRGFGGSYRVLALTANENVDRIEQQARAVKPKVVALLNPEKAEKLRKRLAGSGIRVLQGLPGLVEIASMPKADLVFSAMVGAAGLLPTLTALRLGKRVAVANKEPLVMAGEIFREEIKKRGVRLLPVDSEHSAIFQCLNGEHPSKVRRLILTASGGPFLRTPLARLKNVTAKQALKHPVWKMGKKITLDSATMMNKGLEVIEAHFLFDMPLSKIETVIHPQSIIHSMVEYVDGATLAQMSYPDMKLPIQYAMTYPERLKSKLPSLDLVKLGKLDFFKPDMERFPCLGLAYKAAKLGKTFPAVLNAANETVNAAFFQGRIAFTGIPRVIGMVLDEHKAPKASDLDSILAADAWARHRAENFIAQER